MEATHAPGPWKVVGNDTVVPEATGAILATVLDGSSSELNNVSVSKANARLIAAAPELLTACETLHDLIGKMIGQDVPFAKICDARDVARLAMIKAKGLACNA